MATIHQIDPADRVSLSIRSLSVRVKGKNILEDVSFDLPSGKLLAIMGGSGSGKTTLLNALSQRVNVSNKKLSFSGRVTYHCDNSYISHAYLLQTDVFLAGLTTYETLVTQGKLRGATDTSSLQAHVESLLQVLDLGHLRDTIVVPLGKGSSTFSGGEQRRLSLAIQLLSKPALLFLDEPTTGLDSASSLKLVSALHKLCREVGITVIFSVHQPRSEIVSMFDRMCLLARGGRVVYYGNVADAEEYFFTDFGSLQNFMDASIAGHDHDKSDSLVQKWHTKSDFPALQYHFSEQDQFKANLKLFIPHKTTFWNQFKVLTKRSFLLTYRDFWALVAFDGAVIVLALATGLIFFQPGSDLAGIRSKTSSLFVMLEVVGFCPMMFDLERLWSRDGIYFAREYGEGIVSPTSFILSRRVAKLLIEDIPSSFAFAAITYFMWGLRMHDAGGAYDASYFGIYLALTFLVHMVGVASSSMLYAVSPTFTVSTLMLTIFYQLQNSACGYFVNARTMPVYVRWTKYCAYFWYAFGALAANQYTNWQGDCPYEDSASCIEYTGNNQLKVLGFPKNWVAEPIGILVAWFVGFHLIALVGLHLKNYDVSIAGQRKNKIDPPDHHHTHEGHTDAAAADAEKSDFPFDITLSNVGVSVGEKRILSSVNAHFDGGKINVIMGPSGSGKTTMLNHIAGRSKKTPRSGWAFFLMRILSTPFFSSGTILLNSQEVTPDQIGRIAAFVAQHDNSLLPKLTVRETLYYQAKLRLPTSQHHEIPRIISTLIRQVGLLECAETPIGDESLKGISGGEKRRVSIAIQLLSKPKVLFLDEPTSGLDSTTSANIVSLLHQLAHENNSTVIMTIHQPNDLIFSRFGRLLLLAQGKTVYDGNACDIAHYLDSRGFAKYPDVAIADHVMDLLTRAEDESQSQADSRISALIHEWNEKTYHDFSDSSSSSTCIIPIHDYYFKQLPAYITFPIILSRQFKHLSRSFDIIVTRAGQTIFVAIVHALYFAPLRNGADGAANRLGLVQEVLNLYFIGFMNNISIYPVERDLFYQEYKDGLYGVGSFSLSYLINEVPEEIIPTLFFSAMVVFACGLPRTPGMFFSMFFTAFATINTGESIGIFTNSVFSHLSVATAVLSNAMIIAIFMGGTMAVNMPRFFRGINYVSPLKYAVQINAQIAMDGQKFNCGDACELNTGEKVLEYYNLKQGLGGLFGGLVAILVLYRLIAVAALYIRVRA